MNTELKQYVLQMLSERMDKAFDGATRTKNSETLLNIYRAELNKARAAFLAVERM